MHPSLLRAFQLQVAFQCRAVSTAAADINTAISRLNAGDMTAMPHLWIGIQNLLNAAANVSKACWGQGGKLSKERKPLRDSLGVKASSPIRKTGLRNNFEHFDERLDDWWMKSKHHNFCGHERRNKSAGLTPSTRSVSLTHEQWRSSSGASGTTYEPSSLRPNESSRSPGQRL